MSVIFHRSVDAKGATAMTNGAHPAKANSTRKTRTKKAATTKTATGAKSNGKTGGRKSTT